MKRRHLVVATIRAPLTSDCRRYGRGGDSPAHSVEHLPRRSEVEQCVDEQRLVAVDDEAGIAVAL
jgi:hypothetical protein